MGQHGQGIDWLLFTECADNCDRDSIVLLLTVSPNYLYSVQSVLYGVIRTLV